MISVCLLICAWMDVCLCVVSNLLRIIHIWSKSTVFSLWDQRMASRIMSFYYYPALFISPTGCRSLPRNISFLKALCQRDDGLSKIQPTSYSTKNQSKKSCETSQRPERILNGSMLSSKWCSMRFPVTSTSLQRPSWNTVRSNAVRSVRHLYWVDAEKKEYINSHWQIHIRRMTWYIHTNTNLAINEGNITNIIINIEVCVVQISQL